ncbi:hypothetical protein [Rhizobium sp. BK176]|uniref:hypothetical protein n=1 Tax=Rhizobium sp. BK176 TaxID=2587071 RepID=UPI00216938F5|nr:hypothetical protein [Rhizobium sp. BK176]MCS4089458.1 hypothetical protein [Rhizobium sp. BK176]
MDGAGDIVHSVEVHKYGGHRLDLSEGFISLRLWPFFYGAIHISFELPQTPMAETYSASCS